MSQGLDVNIFQQIMKFYAHAKAQHADWFVDFSWDMKSLNNALEARLSSAGSRGLSRPTIAHLWGTRLGRLLVLLADTDTQAAIDCWQAYHFCSTTYQILPASYNSLDRFKTVDISWSALSKACDLLLQDTQGQELSWQNEATKIINIVSEQAAQELAAEAKIVTASDRIRELREAEGLARLEQLKKHEQNNFDEVKKEEQQKEKKADSHYRTKLLKNFFEQWKSGVVLFKTERCLAELEQQQLLEDEHEAEERDKLRHQWLDDSWLVEPSIEKKQDYADQLVKSLQIHFNGSHAVIFNKIVGALSKESFDAATKLVSIGLYADNINVLLCKNQKAKTDLQAVISHLITFYLIYNTPEKGQLLIDKLNNMIRPYCKDFKQFERLGLLDFVSFLKHVANFDTAYALLPQPDCHNLFSELYEYSVSSPPPSPSSQHL